MKRTLFLALLVALATMVNFPVAAQRRDCTLTGVVLGLDGRPVAHARVTYQSGGGSAPHVTRSDARGHFSAVKLRADIYDVRASAQGVYSEWEKNVNIRPGQTKTLTLRLTHAQDAPPAPPATQP
jgi:hypothetical protein